MNETKFWPCEYIKQDPQFVRGWKREIEGVWYNIPSDENFCPKCGAQCPEPSDGLAEIFDKHRNKYKSGREWQSEISKDLREWKEKGTVLVTDAKPVEEGKPKLLWEILKSEYINPKLQRDYKTGGWEGMARIALDWFERILPKPLEDGLEWNTCLRKIRQRLAEEKEEV